MLINKQCEKKIYYNALLPYEINILLNNNGGKNRQVLISLDYLPLEKNEITNIVINFIRDREKQVLLRSGKNFSLKELLKHTSPDNIKFGFSYTGLGYDIEKPYEYLFHHDIYMYAINEELNITIPLERMMRVEMAKYQIPGIVRVGEVEYYNCYDVVHMVDRDEIQIG